MIAGNISQAFKFIDLIMISFARIKARKEKMLMTSDSSNGFLPDLIEVTTLWGKVTCIILLPYSSLKGGIYFN